MNQPDESRWTDSHVLKGLGLAFAGDATCGFIVERAREVLGKDSPEWIALMLRADIKVPEAAGAISLRRRCQEGIGWHGTRSELYRRSRNGAVRVAAALTAAGVKVPERIIDAS